MRVKLAVETLSLKVANEMECDKQSTSETRKFILMCQLFWSVFNDPTPLRTIDDHRLSKLDVVVQYFHDWENWLSEKYKTKTEQAKHYISLQTKFDPQVSFCFT